VQVADVLTKALPSSSFVDFRTKLNVVASKEVHHDEAEPSTGRSREQNVTDSMDMAEYMDGAKFTPRHRRDNASRLHA
ncbi:hypothetical protein PIB30_040601, partial [Stylosanthes scabra]|nr:hypothetical protein [Stylosanthes scabra]